jgi:thiol-disulfide isomerase/thioredoxin
MPTRSIPPIVAQTAESKPFHLDASSVKKPTLLVFWATWCEPCRKEIPHLIDWQKEHGSDTNIVGVNMDEDFTVAQKLIKKLGINYENIEDKKGKIADEFFIVYTPTMVLVDTKGRIVKESNRFSDMKETLLSLTTPKQSLKTLQ